MLPAVNRPLVLKLFGRHRKGSKGGRNDNDAKCGVVNRMKTLYGLYATSNKMTGLILTVSSLLAVLEIVWWRPVAMT